MSIFQNQTQTPAAQNTRPVRPVRSAPSTNENPEPREKAKLWLNFGIRDDQGRLCQLPFGIALDQIQYFELKGQNQDYIDQLDTANALIEALVTQAGTLAPGETIPVLIDAEIRRVKETLAPSTGDRSSKVTSILDRINGRGPAKEPGQAPTE